MYNISDKIGGQKMIISVDNKKTLNDFIYFIKDIYKNDEHYVYPIFFAVKKELSRLVLEEKTYKAILSVEQNQIKGRILYTIEYSKKQQKKICYFSFFDCYDDIKTVNELFEYLETDMKNNNIDYMEGAFSPYDPDTRRGILVSGFQIDPTIFTAYNKDYYGRLLESYGFRKAIDTVSLNAKVDDKSKKRLNTLSKYFTRSHDVRIDSLDFKNLDKDMNDVHEILKVATNDISIKMPRQLI